MTWRRGTRVFSLRPAAAISFEEVKRATSFQYSGAPIIPSLWVKGLEGGETERVKTKAMLNQVLASVRANLQGYADSNLPLDNVARSQAYALSQLYPLLITPEGQPIGEGTPSFPPENMQAVR